MSMWDTEFISTIKNRVPIVPRGKHHGVQYGALCSTHGIPESDKGDMAQTATEAEALVKKTKGDPTT